MGGVKKAKSTQVLEKNTLVVKKTAVMRRVVAKKTKAVVEVKKTRKVRTAKESVPTAQKAAAKHPSAKKPPPTTKPATTKPAAKKPAAKKPAAKKPSFRTPATPMAQNTLVPVIPLLKKTPARASRAAKKGAEAVGQEDLGIVPPTPDLAPPNSRRKESGRKKSGLSKYHKPCVHGVSQMGNCVVCNGCEHGVIKSNCAVCSGCPHGKARRSCTQCNLCIHGKGKRNCILCCKQCAHGRRKNNCPICSDCGHGRVKALCGICGKGATAKANLKALGLYVDDARLNEGRAITLEEAANEMGAKAREKIGMDWRSLPRCTWKEDSPGCLGS